MHSSTTTSLFAIAGLASTALGVADFARAGAVLGDVAARADDTECGSDVLELFSDLPMPSGDLLTWLGQYAVTADVSTLTTATDLCATPTELPASLSTEYASYESSAWSWYSAESTAAQSVLSACMTDPAFASIATQAMVAIDMVSNCSPGAGASATPTGSGSVTPAPTGSMPSSSTTGGAGVGATETPIIAAAPRFGATGVVLAAAAAGAIGAAILM